MKEVVLKVEGMSCSHCVNTVRKRLIEMLGVFDAQVNLETGEVKVLCGDDMPKEYLTKAIEEEGYSAQ